MALVGLDVHQAQTVAALLDPSTGELSLRRLRGEPARVVPVFLEELDRPVAAVYEAGPTGFALARVADQRGLDVRVVAPGSIPRAPGDRVKTDRRDAKRLVRLFAAGELSYAFVPSETDERFRDLVRCIEDARKDLMRSRHRLSKFLLRRGHRFPCKAWTQPHERWLGKLSFEDAVSQATIATGQPSARACRHAKPDRTLVSCRSPGAASAGCTSAGRTSRAPEASAPAQSRSPAHASSPHSVGRPRPWTKTRTTSTTNAPAAAGAPRATNRADTSPINGPANKGYGQPAVSPNGWRPILDCEPGDEQGS
jgi:hypothetical protein